MSDVFDLVVVGAGPGGLAAAATACEAGMRVCLIDDNPEPGGQIWRKNVARQAVNTDAAKWLRSIQSSRVVMRSGWRVVDGSASAGQTPVTLRIEQEGRWIDLECSTLILATGARELFLPFPGWTLPGIFGVGGIQAFVKSGLDISGKRVVIAGTGPLLLAVAASLHRAGAQIVTVVEQAPMARMAKFSFGLLWGHAGKLVEGARYGWSLLGIPYRTGSWVTSAVGDEHLRKVEIQSGSQALRFDADMLAVGFHLVPNTELAQLLGCEQRHGYVLVDDLQQTTAKGIYCVGEAAGIGGAEKAQIEGRIAALAVSGQEERAKALFRIRDRQMHFAQRLGSAFVLREELRTLAKDETVVCRCEDVTHGSLVSRRSWREAKLHTRCGMGPCQGRVCGAATRFLYGWDIPDPRPPLFPVEVSALAGMQAVGEGQRKGLHR